VAFLETFKFLVLLSLGTREVAGAEGRVPDETVEVIVGVVEEGESRKLVAEELLSFPLAALKLGLLLQVSLLEGVLKELWFVGVEGLRLPLSP
jgi:hypothetical protein